MITDAGIKKLKRLRKLRELDLQGTQVTDAGVAAYAVANLNQAITQWASTRLRAVVGAASLHEVMTDPLTVNGRLLDGADRATALWGVKINRLEIKDVQPVSQAS